MTKDTYEPQNPINFKTILDYDLNQQIVFIRADMNVPIMDNIISDDTRIKMCLKTIRYALSKNARVIVATHFGRPQEGVFDSANSVQLIALHLAKLLNLRKIPVVKLEDALSYSDSKDMFNALDSAIVMLENVRCNIGEKANAQSLGIKYASLCNIFVHDAFAAAHRAEASTDAIANFTQITCAGLLMMDELNALNHAVLSPKKPFVAIVGGSKVSTKLAILQNLITLPNLDYLILGGGILNTFLLASGYNIANSLHEADLVTMAQQILSSAAEKSIKILLPEFVVVSNSIALDTVSKTKHITELLPDEAILDISQEFANKIVEILQISNSIIWNGPLGMFEHPQFQNGTKIVACGIANSNAYSLAGGGDTIAAINKFGIADNISYISTAGGALLEFLGGLKLPAIELLQKYVYRN